MTTGTCEQFWCHGPCFFWLTYDAEMETTGRGVENSKSVGQSKESRCVETCIITSTQQICWDSEIEGNHKHVARCDTDRLDLPWIFQQIDQLFGIESFHFCQIETKFDVLEAISS